MILVLVKTVEEEIKIVPWLLIVPALLTLGSPSFIVTVFPDGIVTISPTPIAFGGLAPPHVVAEFQGPLVVAVYEVACASCGKIAMTDMKAAIIGRTRILFNAKPSIVIKVDLYKMIFHIWNQL